MTRQVFHSRVDDASYPMDYTQSQAWLSTGLGQGDLHSDVRNDGGSALQREPEKEGGGN